MAAWKVSFKGRMDGRKNITLTGADTKRRVGGDET
jgi:hypothetical protein